MADLLGLHVPPKDLDLLQVCLRGVIVFIVTLVMVRVADKRFLAKMAPFDVILSFILASMIARAVNGSAPFFPTLAAGFVLVLLHRLLAVLAFHWSTFGRWIKGEPDLLVKDGQPQSQVLRRYGITETDLLEELRLNGNLETLQQVKKAMIERNGHVSVIPVKD